jgi:alpha-beta hydrolase superfamily lysophospholipase
MATPDDPQIRTFLAPDGKELAYVVHSPATGSINAAAFLYLHGIESHAGWFRDAAERLKQAGHFVYCLDRRGSGLNRENRDHPSGHLPGETDLLDDLHAWVQHLRILHETRPFFLIGLSWGGKYALAYDIVHPGMIDGLVLITPGIKPQIGLGFRQKLAVLRDLLVSPARQHRIPLEPKMFTRTPRHVDFIRNDPLRLHTVSARFLWQSHRLDRLLARTRENAGAPVLLFLAGKDRIIDNQTTRRFFARRPPGEVTILEYPDQTHSIQLDAPERLTRDILAWVQTVSR